MIVRFKKEEISKVINSISALTNLVITVIDSNNIGICAAGPTYRYCDRLNELMQNRSACVECDKILLEKCNRSKKMEYHVCHAGLYDFAMPIIKNDSIVGHVLMGRIRPKESKPVEKYTVFDDGTLSDLYYKLPRLSKEQIEALPVLFENLNLGQYVFVNENKEIEKITTYIHENISHKLTAKEICDEFGISKTKLYAMFSKEYNMPFNHYVVDRRMLIAIELLLNTEMALGQVAKAVGYSNQNYFAKIFKETTGKSASSIRKRMRNQYM